MVSTKWEGSPRPRMAEGGGGTRPARSFPRNERRRHFLDQTRHDKDIPSLRSFSSPRMSESARDPGFLRLAISVFSHHPPQRRRALLRSAAHPKLR